MTDSLATASMDEEGRPPRVLRTIIATSEGRIGLVVIAVMLFIIALGPFLAPYPPNQLATGPPLEPPTFHHYFGTDQLGRDVLSRFLAGGRTVLLVPLAAVTLAFVLGAVFGLLGAYWRGVADEVLTRSFDFLMALPALLIVLVLIWAFGTSALVIIVVVAAIFTPRLGRVLRGAAQGVVTQDYVYAAQARGEGTGWILGREILPNIAAIAIANYALFLTYGVIFISTLSFLGLGAQPPSSDWGLMVANSVGFVMSNPWATLLPAFGIAALSLGFILLGDALTRYLTRDVERSMVHL